MKTWSMMLIAGIVLLLIQLLLVIFSSLGSGAVFAWVRSSFWHTIVYCLPAIIGVTLLSYKRDWRKEVEDRVWDPNRIDPNNR